MTVIATGITFAVIYFFVQNFHSSVPKCTSQYPLQEIHSMLDKNYTWEYVLSTNYKIQPTNTDIKSIGDTQTYDIRADYPKNLEFLKKYEPETFIEVTSYVGTIQHGINIVIFSDYRNFNNKIEDYIFIDSINNGKKEGLRYVFANETLEYVYDSSQDIKISFRENKPAMIEIGNSDGTKMTIANNSGDLRGMKQSDKQEYKTGWRNTTYRTGEKCIESIEENNIHYWEVYNKTGAKLFKWPKNDDFCKARVINDNKEIKLPLYFDMNKFQKIERKIYESTL